MEPARRRETRVSADGFDRLLSGATDLRSWRHCPRDGPVFIFFALRRGFSRGLGERDIECERSHMGKNDSEGASQRFAWRPFMKNNVFLSSFVAVSTAVVACGQPASDDGLPATGGTTSGTGGTASGTGPTGGVAGTGVTGGTATGGSAQG